MSSATEQNTCDAHLPAAAVVVVAADAAAASTVASPSDAASAVAVVDADADVAASLTNIIINAEVDALKQALLEKQSQLVEMETVCLRESDRQVELEDSVIAWQDKYDRLYESHKRVQKVNQGLEDKLLKLVDRNTGERAQLTSDVATLSVRLAQANFNIAKLQREIERYKADINLAIQLLQCKPDSFVPHKVSSLPIDIQSKVSAYMRLETNSHSDSEGSTSGVAMTASYKVLPASDSPPPAPCPFPPTAMVYSMRGLDDKKNNSNSTLNLSVNNNNNNNNVKESINNNTNTCNSTISLNSTTNTINGLPDPDMISPIIMAKFLEDELKAGEIKHCDTCQCSKQDLTVLADVSRSYTVATQTPFQYSNSSSGGGGGGGNLNEPLAQLCLRCNSNLNSPSRTNSPYLMKLVKSSDSVISETKSSVSDLNDMDKLFLPAKKDDLMVNPILGHHRLCDRTSGSGALHHSSSLLAGNAKQLTSTMLYPTTHLGAYAAEKYLLETSSLAAGLNGQLRSAGYHRRFLDGGGTALELLGKYELSVRHTPKKEKLIEVNGNDDLEDEAKPLLSATSHSNLHEAEKTKNTMESSGELSQQVTSPTSTCSAVHTKNNLIKSTTISGSVNSLWSKTSSCEGAKMFENFNRNLIKTIKAENPKNRGPRLCAMRIQQNGQSNILLDSIESVEAVTPIIYKRRERLLDEELDDTKDIITSKTTSAMCIAATDNKTIEGLGLTTQTTLSIDEVIHEDCPAHAHTTGSCNDAGGGSGESKGGGGVDGGDTSEKSVPKIITAIVESKPELKTANIKDNVESIRTTEQVDLLAGDVTNNLIALQLPNELQPLVEKQSPSYEILRNESSSKNSLNSKSCTQSSSISDVIDFQESVILRRQQLSRVAEWVQNNTQQLVQQQQHQQQQQQQQVINSVHHCDSSGTDKQSSFSTLDQFDSVSIEKLSMDSGYKTTPQPQTTNGFADNKRDDADKSPEDSLSPKTDTTTSNHNHNYNHLKQQQQQLQQLQMQPQEVLNTANTYYRRTSRSGLPVAYTTSGNTKENGHSTTNQCTTTALTTSSSSAITTTTILPAPPTCDILNYKYYPSETDKTRAIKAELHTTTQHVDIAQMEYNVKQFLLKQNEWSMRGGSGSTRPGPGGGGGTNTTTSSNLSSAASQVMSQIAASKTTALRHTKLFSSVGIGPGVGERVRIAPPTSTANETPVVRSTTIPQRTETNL